MGKTIKIDGKEYGSIEDYINGLEIVQPLNPNDWEYRVEDDNTITITGYLNEDKTIDTIIVPNYIGELPVKKIVGKGDVRINFMYPIWNEKISESSKLAPGTSTFVKENTTIKKIVVSNGIETIEGTAFAATVNLTEVILPNTLVNLQGFQHCTSLTTINIPSSVTNIGEKAFVGSSLTEVTIPESVTTMERMVFGSKNTTVHVFWKQGAKPEGWSDNWDAQYEGRGKPNVIYAE